YSDGGTGGFVVLGVILTATASIMLTQNQELVAAALHRVTDRPTQGALSVRLAVAYPIAKRNRTGLILLMYSVVVFTLVLLTILAGLFSGNSAGRIATLAGGYDFAADFFAVPAGTDTVKTLRDSQFGADLGDLRATQVGEVSVNHVPAVGGDVQENVNSIDATFAAGGFLKLSKRDARFATDAAAWEALAREPSSVIVNRFFGQRGGGGPPQDYVRIGETVRITPVGGKPVD